MTKTAVITGASSGIGTEAAKALVAAGWTVAVVGRNPERTRAVAASLDATPFLADYDRLDDVRALAAALLERYDSIDVLANNAGGLVSKRGRTADGHEWTFQHNHLAPFLLTDLLYDRLVDSSARVVGTASLAHRVGRVRLDDLDWEKRAYLGGWIPYGTSKLETVLFMRELARRSPLEAYSIHPGYVATAFGSDNAAVRLGARFSRATGALSAVEGAAPIIMLALADRVDAPNGSYFDRLEVGRTVHRDADDRELAAALWSRSCELTSATRLATIGV